jgi:hypothetical protein
VTCLTYFTKDNFTTRPNYFHKLKSYYLYQISILISILNLFDILIGLKGVQKVAQMVVQMRGVQLLYPSEERRVKSLNRKKSRQKKRKEENGKN